MAKTLGIYWNNNSDTFKYKVSSLKDTNDRLTKRRILSEASKLFDPIGWVQPIIIVAKIFLQELWAKKVEWDEPLDELFSIKWGQYKDDLLNVSKIEIPRWVEYNRSKNKYEIHVFADASERAYGAVAYLRNTTEEKVYMLMAKSRVAPLKSITLDRLELCAAVLATGVVSKLKNVFDTDDIDIFAWSDSTITLAWINKPSNTWKTFVSHRVAEIQGIVDKNNWNYVRSAEDPADLISRRTDAETLRQSQLWWHGPSWLAGWSAADREDFETNEEKSQKVIVMHSEAFISEPKFTVKDLATPGKYFNVLEKFSSFNKLVRVLWWVQRAASCFKSRNKNLVSDLSIDELQNATDLIIKLDKRKRLERKFVL